MSVIEIKHVEDLGDLEVVVDLMVEERKAMTKASSRRSKRIYRAPVEEHVYHAFETHHQFFIAWESGNPIGYSMGRIVNQQSEKQKKGEKVFVSQGAYAKNHKLEEEVPLMLAMCELKFARSRKCEARYSSFPMHNTTALDTEKRLKANLQTQEVSGRPYYSSTIPLQHKNYSSKGKPAYMSMLRKKQIQTV